MSEPSFLSVAQRDRREGHRCPEGATERCERDFLRVALASAIANAIPRESLSLCEAMDLTTASIAEVVPLNMNRKHSEFVSPESSDRSLAADVLLRQEPEEEEDEEDDDGPKDDNDDDEEGDGYSACLCFRGGLVLMGAVHMM